VVTVTPDREQIVTTIEAELRRLYRWSAPTTDQEWREDAEAVADDIERAQHDA
jgi:hypothetical protein